MKVVYIADTGSKVKKLTKKQELQQAADLLAINLRRLTRRQAVKMFRDGTN